MNLIVSPSALADLKRLQAFLAGTNPIVASRAITTIVAAIDSLIVFPERGRPTKSDNMRELIVPFGRSAYLVRFTHDRESREIVIVRIWHGRENNE